MQFSAGKENKTGMGALFVRPLNEVFQVKNIVECYRNSMVVDLPNPIVVEAKTDIELRAKNLDLAHYQCLAHLIWFYKI